MHFPASYVLYQLFNCCLPVGFLPEIPTEVFGASGRQFKETTPRELLLNYCVDSRRQVFQYFLKTLRNRLAVV